MQQYALQLQRWWTAGQRRSRAASQPPRPLAVDAPPAHDRRCLLAQPRTSAPPPHAHLTLQLTPGRVVVRHGVREALQHVEVVLLDDGLRPDLQDHPHHALRPVHPPIQRLLQEGKRCEAPGGEGGGGEG